MKSTQFVHRFGRMRTLAAVAAAVVIPAVVMGGVASAQATPSTFNPFDVNGGFTVVSQGDVTLNSGEFEGSVAAFGSVSTSNDRFTLLHQAAGSANYTVPTIDDTPVRLLAQSTTGSGLIDISDRDDSGTITPDSNEANAVAKFVTLDGVTASSRSGGTGRNDGKDYLRLTNSAEGTVDLKAAPADTPLSALKTDKASVKDYFPELDARVAAANTCLASLYEPGSALTNTVKLDDRGGLVFASSFATDKPNVIDYAAIAGKTIKLDDAAGYKPSPAAPIVVRVPAETTEIGSLQFEGWDASHGTDQALAQNILLDLSQVTGDVKIDGLTMGSIWAPQASLTFDSSITTNGQWFAGGSVTTGPGNGEIHNATFTGILPCATAPTPTTTGPVPPVPPTTTEPVPTTTEPVPTTTEPVPTTTGPVPTTTGPVPTTTESVPTTTGPVPTTTESVPTTTVPATTSSTTTPALPSTTDSAGPTSNGLASTGAHIAWPLLAVAALGLIGGATMLVRSRMKRQ